jgi:hypothetical protein
MPKIELVALAATGLLIFGGVFSSAPAFAEDDDNEDKEDSKRSSQVTPTQKPQEAEEEDEDEAEDESQESELNETAETELKHQELEEKYGKDGHLSLPPLVIRPEGYVEISRTSLMGGAGAFAGLPRNPGALNGTNEDRPTETVIIDPEKNIAIDISAVSSARKTPADVFLESATTGLFAMGFGAVGLGVVAGTRAIRRR